MDDTDLVRRAFAAYFRAGGSDQPGVAASGVMTHKRLHYVLLRSGKRVLAVYRVKADGALRRLKRWPKEIEHP